MQINKIKITKYRYWAVCKCGTKIYGISEDHVKANYKQHKKSKGCKK